MSLDCARCGTAMDDRRDRFWCDRCGAYFCGRCIGLSGRCPHCGNENLPDEHGRLIKYASMIVACTVAIVVASVIVATWWLNYSQPAGGHASSKEQADVISMAVSLSVPFPLLAGFGNYMMNAYGRQFEHVDFVRRHAGKEWTQQEKPEVGPDGSLIGEAVQRVDPLGTPINPEWMPNMQYFRTRNQFVSYFLVALAIFVISVIYVMAIPHQNETCMVIAGIGMLMGGISMFSVVLTGYFGLGSLPTHVAVSSQGINLKYRSERAPRHLLQKILYINELMTGKDNDMTNLIMKVNGGTKSTQIDRPYQRRILREWCRRNPESDAANEYAKYAK
jgi:hypothetical protein